MIVTRIIPHAGMGNQMFMYSAGLALATRLNTELRLGAWDFDWSTRKDRPYELNVFPNITEPNASINEMWQISPRMALIISVSQKRIRRYHIFRRLIRKIAAKLLKPQNIYEPPYNSWATEFYDIPDNTYIIGYWESEKFFENIKPLVRTKFQFPDKYFKSEWVSKIQTCNSVAIHIRRGDKVRVNDYRASDEYYAYYLKHAMQKICSLTENPEFFVFSDDINFCKLNLPKIYDAKYHFVENQTPPQDMALMTICKHVIISPSTFSWWGAWLNNNPSKIIISPGLNLWYAQDMSRQDLLPPEWITIN